MTTEITAPTLRGAIQTVQRIASRQPLLWATPGTFRHDPNGPALIAMIYRDHIKLWARTVDGRRGTLEALVRFETDPIAQIDYWYKHGYLTHAESRRLEDEARVKCDACGERPAACRLDAVQLCVDCYLIHSTPLQKEAAA